MPFNVPYKLTFTAGDLIYGLSAARPELVKRLAVGILTVGGPATVDQYRKSSMEDLTKQDRQAWKSFLQDNQVHKRYGRYHQAIRSYNNDEEKFAQGGARAALQNSAWRAKSKFGMEWTLSNQRGHIHFMLDQIDMGAVVSKTHLFTAGTTVLAQDTPQGKAPNGVDKERTITHSELRWIYRNRNNPLVQGRIQFWMTTAGTVQACAPPWLNTAQTTTLPTVGVVTWQQAWLTYVPTAEPNAF
ncbi:MAG: hypothetical protein JOZ51_26310 [Chloroflexi bacterium]|nr:hypothetical protein [Chloroflexota bacterium]